MSWSAAPPRDVTIPMRRGRRGSFLLLGKVKEPFGREPRLELLEGELERPHAVGL